MILRPYQKAAIEATFQAWETSRSVLGVAATGLGKTILFASILKNHPGRTMVLAHRAELIHQAHDKVLRVTGHDADIEMADSYAAEGMLHGKARVVIGTVQTQVAGRDGGRMTRFDPYEFSLLVVDEAHHSTADTYRRIIDYYRTNPDLQVFGVTATPDRADEQALGQVYNDVAFDYDVRFGVEQAWLVPITQRMVHVDGLDLSQIRTTAGDLNGADLARVMEYEGNLHRIASPTIELTEGKKTLVFASSLAHAERLTEILNRHRSGSAEWVHGKTPTEDRAKMFKAYARGQFQYLVNVGVATEGFDDPSIQSVVLARPTKSRALYAQMIGRGTRTLDGTLTPDLYEDLDGRRAAISASGKQHVEVIDFVGNAGKHKLCSTADILGGIYSDEVVDRARQMMEADEEPRDAMKALEEAEEQLKKEAEERARRDAARRAGIKAKASFKTTTINPFDVFGLMPRRARGWDTDKQPSEKMIALLEKQGINTAGMSFTQARQLITEITGRWDKGQCSFKQAKLLKSRGMPTDVTREEASRMIDEISAREGWGRSKSREPVQVF